MGKNMLSEKKRAPLKLWKAQLYTLVIFAMLATAHVAGAVPGENIFPNPIDADDFGELVQAIASALIKIVTPLAVVAIIFTGFRFITASLQGNTGEIAKTKTMLLWVLVGSAVIVGASALAIAAVNFAKNL